MNSKMLQNLLTEGIISSLHNLEEVDSTNTYLKAYLGKDALPSLAVTDNQTAGKGRMGRVWSCPKGENIAMSYLFCPSKDTKNLSSVTLLAALAITDAIRELFPVSAGIKWPNDVIVGTKKICGILTEMVSDGTANYVIIGIGINVNTTSFPDELKEKATSLFLETGADSPIQPEPFVTLVTKKLKQLIDAFEACGDLSFIREKYNELLINRGKLVSLSTDNVAFPKNPYTCLGINAEGGLLVTDCDGALDVITTGEVSVRGLLGYVN